MTGKTFPAFPAHAHQQFCVSGKRPMCKSCMYAVEGSELDVVSYPKLMQLYWCVSSLASASIRSIEALSSHDSSPSGSGGYVLLPNAPAFFVFKPFLYFSTWSYPCKVICSLDLLNFLLNSWHVRQNVQWSLLFCYQPGMYDSLWIPQLLLSFLNLRYYNFSLNPFSEWSLHPMMC